MINLTSTALDYKEVSKTDPNTNQPVYPDWKEFHDNLQGNILKGHGRDRVVLLFLRFPDANTGRRFIKMVLPFVTSATDQIEQSEKFKRTNTDSDLFANFFLTYAGYKILGVPEHLIPQEASFKAGMGRSPISELGDLPSSDWESGFDKFFDHQANGVEQQRVHSLLLLAADEKALLNAKLTALNDFFLNMSIEVLCRETGQVLRNGKHERIEHFGYADGLSQPLFYLQDIQSEVKQGAAVQIGSRIPNAPTFQVIPQGQFDPTAALNLALVREPGANPNCFGSYLVFRKLEQNVQGFEKRKQDLANKLRANGNPAPPDDLVKLAGAMALGRFEDGTPVVLSELDGMTSPISNNFNYQNDGQGTKCPFHAHIRKANQRPVDSQSSVMGRLDRTHRIVRRGIPYGERTVEPKDNPTIEQMPTDGVGLLFMCFQSDISEQFKFIQQNWANKEEFPQNPHYSPGLDPVIGQIFHRNSRTTTQNWPVTWGQPGTFSFSFDGFVKMKGGEYFFAPSLAFLERL